MIIIVFILEFKKNKNRDSLNVLAGFYKSYKKSN